MPSDLFNAPLDTSNGSGGSWFLNDGDGVLGTHWTISRLATGGEAGQPAYEITEVPGRPAGQFEWGWDGEIIPTWTNNNSRFFKWRQHISGNLDANPSNKLLLYQQGCNGGHCRVIIQCKAQGSSNLVLYEIQIDGGVDHFETGYVYASPAWFNIQVEVHSNTSSGQANGYYKVWVNNDTYASPTLTSGSIILDVGDIASNYVMFGGYNNTGTVTGAQTNVQRYTNFQIASTFDSTWYTNRLSNGGAGGDGEPPSDNRFRRMAGGYL